MPEENEENENTDPAESADIRQVREALKRERKARTAAEETASTAPALAMENAMLRAGIDVDTPLGKMFATSYNGELDKTAITAAWNALGVTPSSGGGGGGEGEDPTQEELERQERERLLTDGRTPPGGEPKGDPYIQALGAYHDEGGGRAVEAQRAGLQVIMNEAAAGNPMVMNSGTIDTDTRDRWLKEHKKRMRQVRDLGGVVQGSRVTEGGQG